MLVRFAIGADDGQCHKNLIVTMIVGNKRSRKVVHCSGTVGIFRAGLVQPLLILWPYQSFPTMGTNGDKCRLLLVEDSSLEAQPQHGVTVGVGRNFSQRHDTVGPSARFAEDLPAL